MCSQHRKIMPKLPLSFWVLLALVFGTLCGFYPLPGQEAVATAIMSVFANILKLISLPIIFLSLVTSFTGIKSADEYKKMSLQTIRWTLITTVIAATVALALFLIIRPQTTLVNLSGELPLSRGFVEHLLKIIPSNFFQPFFEGNVIAVLLLAVGLGWGLLSVPGRDKVHEVLSPLLAALMKLVYIVVAAIPLTVWASIVLSFNQLQDLTILKQLGLYLLVVVGANILQALVVLPIILKIKGISPFRTMRQFLPALTMAFFSKSSVATLPVAMRTAEEKLSMDPKVSRFVFPICTTINMNGCAAFILATTLFVAVSCGVHFTPLGLVGWVVLATLAAIGNAGVPMGCFFLSTAILATMNLPLGLMGLILPFYNFIDMLETAINVWSDTTVALVVNRQTEKEKAFSHTPAIRQDNA